MASDGPERVVEALHLSEVVQYVLEDARWATRLVEAVASTGSADDRVSAAERLAALGFAARASAIAQSVASSDEPLGDRLEAVRLLAEADQLDEPTVAAPLLGAIRDVAADSEERRWVLSLASGLGVDWVESYAARAAMHSATAVEMCEIAFELDEMEDGPRPLAAKLARLAAARVRRGPERREIAALLVDVPEFRPLALALVRVTAQDERKLESALSRAMVEKARRAALIAECRAEGHDEMEHALLSEDDEMPDWCRWDTEGVDVRGEWIPLPPNDTPLGYEVAATDIGLDVDAVFAREMWQDAELMRAAVEWGVERRAIDSRSADAFVELADARAEWLMWARVELEGIAVEMQRWDLANAGTPRSLITWGSDEGHLHPAHARELRRALDGKQRQPRRRGG